MESKHPSYQAESVAKRKGENFPVASLLLPKKIRQQVIALYHFARHADDIADDGTIPASERKQQLQLLYEQISHPAKNTPPIWAEPYLALVESGEVDARHGQALLQAFIQDTYKNRYATWEELLHYCMFSAAPIGRAMCELHQEWAVDLDASDAICNALQIINHVQDIESDLRERDRCYLPQAWGLDEQDIAQEAMSENLRQLVDKMLDEVDDMLELGKKLPATLRHFRFRAEISIIHALAVALATKLRNHDILARRVSLSKWQKICCVVKGVSRAIFVRKKASSGFMKKALFSKSSFLFPLLQLKGQKKSAMLTFYAFCRVIDDAVDDAPTREVGRENIAFWRAEIARIYTSEVSVNNSNSDYPQHPISRALAPVVQREEIAQHVMEDMLAGQEMDLEKGVTCPDLGELDLYCYRVASCVGLASICIFGYQAKATQTFAIELGKCLQLINIMRDVQEDAERNRIYLPLELMRAQGIEAISPEQLLAPSSVQRDALKKVGEAMAKMAEAHYLAAMQALPEVDRGNMKPALMMHKVYHHYYVMLQEAKWDIGTHRVSMSFIKKCRLAFSA